MKYIARGNRSSIRKVVMASNRQYIKAADEDEFDDYDMYDEDIEEDIGDAVDELNDTAEDLQDTIEEVDEDEVDIDIDANITNHYIAQCDSCKGIFISALIESDQEVESIQGICPLCDKESVQYLKWIVRDIE